MAGCNDDGCSCIVRGTNGVAVSGTGTARDPYVVQLDAAFGGNFVATDTETVNLQLTGRGIAGDPYDLKATATIALTDLTDISDPQGGPAVGETLVWVGAGELGHWEFAPPPAVPPGSVNVGQGITGTGAIGSPIAVKTLSAAGGVTTGLEVYVDSAGNLRAVPPATTAVEWSAVQNKPTSFPTTAADFSGAALPVAKGGTGATSLSTITVGNADKVGNHRIWVQSATPSGAAVDDLWFY